MSIKTKGKFAECKLVVEAVKPYHVVPSDILIERATSKKLFPELKQSSEQFKNFPLTSKSAHNHGFLESLIAKHSMRSRLNEKKKLSLRPMTSMKAKDSHRPNWSELNKEKEQNNPVFFEKKNVMVIGDYEITSDLGRGAYAEVKLGVHRLTGEKVAIKTYEKNRILSVNRRKSVEREIKILKKLIHPNIIHLISTIDTNDCIYLVFEYVSGCSLKDYLNSRSLKRIEESQAKNIFKQIMMALEFCHSIGVSHRDIKLENVLIDENHCVKLIDFGFSTYILSEKKVQFFCGTSAYMAPEIVMNKQLLGPPTDVWAAGVLLFVLVSGTFPFKGKELKEIYSKILNGVYTMPTNFSLPLKELLKSIIEYDPNKRITASQVLKSAWISEACIKSMVSPKSSIRINQLVI